MKFKLSRCIALQHPARDKIVEFYKNVFGLEVKEIKEDMAEIDGDEIRMYIDRGEPRELIIESLSFCPQILQIARKK